MTAEQSNNNYTGFLSEENREKIAKWLNEKRVNMRCFCCGDIGKFKLQELATLPIGWDADTGRVYYAMGAPQVSLICSNCGNILNFSLFTMGITPNMPTESLTENPSTT